VEKINTTRMEKEPTATGGPRRKGWAVAVATLGGADPGASAAFAPWPPPAASPWGLRKEDIRRPQ